LFRRQIQIGEELLAKLRRAKSEGGWNNVPVQVTTNELSIWYTGTDWLIQEAFGESSEQLDKWRLMQKHGGEMITRETLKGDVLQGVLRGHIWNLQESITMLNVFQAEYEHARSKDVSNGVKETKRQVSPTTLWGALLQWLWKIPSPLRYPLLLVILLGAVALAVWGTLPDGMKTEIISWFRTSLTR
jgi:hypothetical protein